MVYQPIENYGIIGNMRTCALVSMNGSIDWYCYPYFDSPSIFGAILDDNKGGRFQISPIAERVRYKQFYWPSTNILVTRFLLSDGIVELEDFMTLGSYDSPWCYHLFRRVRCVKGRVRLSMLCEPAFDYGRKIHELAVTENGALFKDEKLTLSLFSSVPLKANKRKGVVADFILDEGQTHFFILKEGELSCCPPPEKEVETLFQNTVVFWHKWLSACTYRGRWREEVERSALALKLMTFQPTGAIVASPTASLPEVIGGVRNWDYRYTWIRDAAFTVYGFLRIGFREEAEGFMSWLENFATKKTAPDHPLPALFTIHGETEIPEIELPHWEGYKGSKPVRIGNEAVTQFQSDVYGELLDAVYLYNKYVGPIAYDTWVRIRRRMNWISENWRQPDKGIWEMRNRMEHFVYSKVMNWVALDRGIRLADKRSFPSDVERWKRERDSIYEEVLTKGWNQKKQSFTQYYDSEDLDASLLIMPLVFFMAPNDPRMLKTIDAILKSPKEGGLVSGSLVHRYVPEPRIDGFPGEEGTFNMCTFWLVEALTRAGQRIPEKLDQARLLFEKMLGYANHLGLYAEQTGLEGDMLGNFPQAFTHLALISAAFNLDRVLGGR